MHIVVCIKQVPETADIGWDRETGTLIREDASGVLNRNDKNALEAALQLKETVEGAITAVTMGPAQAEEALREALAMGADKAVLLYDKRFAGADTLATAYTLSLALKKLGPIDLIMCGKESSDGMTAHVGPQLAELMDLPQLTCAVDIKVHGRRVSIDQKMENGFRVLESSLPALITVEREINEPRIPPMDRILAAYRESEVLVWELDDLKGDEAWFGLSGSPTQTRKVYSKKIIRGQVRMIEGEPETAAGQLVRILTEKTLI